MPSYNEMPVASSAERALREAAKQVQESPETLKAWARLVARHVYSGALDFAKVWDGLFLASIAGGRDQLSTQQLIGEGFAMAREAVLV